MPYDIHKSKKYVHPFKKVYESAYRSIISMGGKIKVNDLEGKRLHAQMDKKLYGNILGDRSALEITFTEEGEDTTNIDIIAYPLNAVGQKLMFGARKGVVETVLKAFSQEMDKRLTEEE